MEDELHSFSRDSDLGPKVKWYTKPKNIFLIGIALGELFVLCLAAIINLTITNEFRHIVLLWQDIPLNLWISVSAFVLFIIITYFFRLKS